MTALPGVYDNHSDSPTAVVLLHSSLSSARQWQPLVTELTPHRRVINIDLLGYGQALAPSDERPFRLQQEVDRIDDIMAQLGVSRYELVGHSYGAAVALKLAYEQPQRVTRLALFEPVAFHLLGSEDDAYQEVMAVAEPMNELSDPDAARQFVDYWNGAGYFDALPAKLQSVMAADVTKVRQDFEALTGEAYGLSDYAALTMPCLLMAGEQTRHSSLTVAKRLAQVLRHCKFRRLPGGHMAPISHPEAVNQAIVEFLAIQ